MSKHNDEIVVELSIEETMVACKEAAANLNWRIMNEGKNYLSCKEITSHLAFSQTWPAKVEVYVNKYNDKTKIILEGSIFGLGPIQSGHLKGQLGKFKNLIEVSLSHRNNSFKENTNSSSIAIELEKLSELYSKGILSKEEFEMAKKKVFEF